MVGPDSGSVRIQDTMVCSETWLWLFSPAWYAVELTLQVGFRCPFVVIDPIFRLVDVYLSRLFYTTESFVLYFCKCVLHSHESVPKDGAYEL